MKERVLILGASRYYFRAIEKAKKCGFYIILIDKNPDSYSFSIADEYYLCDFSNKYNVLEIAQKCKPDAVIPLNDVGVVTASYVSSKLNLAGLSEKSAILCTDKEMMSRTWTEKGIPYPKSRVASSKEDIIKSIYEVGFPCILKPAKGVGGGSRGVIMVNSESEIEKAIDFTHSFYADKTTLIERFIVSESEHSVEVLVDNNDIEIIAISDKIKSDLPYRVDKCVIYPSNLSEIEICQLKKTIKSAIKSLEINVGSVHVEVAKFNKKFVLFELGARCGGGGTSDPIVPFITNIDLFVEQINLLLGKKLKLNFDNNGKINKACNFHFITPKPGEIKNIEGIEEIKKNDKVLDFSFFKQKGDVIQTVKTGLDRSGFIIVGGKNREDVINYGFYLENKLNITYTEEFNL